MGLFARAICAEFGPKYLNKLRYIQKQCWILFWRNTAANLYWFGPEQEMIFYTDSAANLKGQAALHYQHTASRVPSWSTEASERAAMRQAGTSSKGWQFQNSFRETPGLQAGITLPIEVSLSLLWLPPHSSLASASGGRGYFHDGYQWRSLFFFKLCW